MPRSDVTQNWINAFSRVSCSPVLMASITTTPNGTPYQFHSWCAPIPNPLPLATMGLANIKPVGQRVGLIDRKVSVSAWELTFVDDGRLRAISNSVVLKKKWVRIYLGEASLTSMEDWLIIADNLQIDDVLPEKGAIRVPALDTNAFGLDALIDPYQFSDHPLRIANTLLNTVAPPQATGDPSFNERLYTATSHFMVSRQQYNNLGYQVLFPQNNVARTPVNGLEFMNSLLQLMYGTLYPGPTGVAKYVPWDRAAVAARTFSKDDITDFKQLSNYQDAWNDVFVTCQNALDPSNSDMWAAQAGNSQSQHDFGFPASGGYVAGRLSRDTIKNPWLNSWSRLGADYNPNFDGGATQLSVYLPAYCGFCGSLQTDGSGNLLLPPSTTQQPEHRLSAQRAAVLIITNHHDKGELLTATASAINSGAGSSRISTPQGSRLYWNQMTYTGLSRGLNGSIPQDWRNEIRYQRAWIYDVTIPWWLVGTLIDRFGYGAPIVSFRVNLRNIDLQPGDAIAFTHSVYLAFGVNGATPNSTFEVLSVEPTIIGSGVGLTVTAARIRDGAVGPVLGTDITPPPDIVASAPPEFYWDALGEIYTDAVGLGYVRS